MTDPFGDLAAEVDRDFWLRGNIFTRMDELQVEVSHRPDGRPIDLGALHIERGGRRAENDWVPPVNVSIPVEEMDRSEFGPLLRALRITGLRRALPVAIVIDSFHGWTARWSPVFRAGQWRFAVTRKRIETYGNAATMADMLAIGLTDPDEATLAAIAPMRSQLGERIGHVLEPGHVDRAATLAADAIRSARG